MDGRNTWIEVITPDGGGLVILTRGPGERYYRAALCDGLWCGEWERAYGIGFREGGTVLVWTFSDALRSLAASYPTTGAAKPLADKLIEDLREMAVSRLTPSRH